MGKSARDSKRLTTKAEVMTALGGIAGVSDLTGAEYGAVENWKRAACFPPRYFLVMWLELASRGFLAPPELWGQRQLPRNTEALLVIAAKKARAAA